MRNGIILAVLVFLMFGCMGGYLNPTAEQANNPVWYNRFSYLFFMPLLLSATALVLSDKTWLKQRIPRLQSMKTRHWVVAYFAFFGIMILLLGLAGMLR